MDTKNEYPIVSVCAEELKLAGYDITNVTDDQMYKLAEVMQESYLNKNFYRDLRKAADKLGIPKKKKL